MTTTAKLFMNGASQAVRLPREFRFEGDEVCIRQVGSAVVLFQPGRAWSLLREAAGKVTDDFMADRDQPGKPDARKRL